MKTKLLVLITLILVLSESVFSANELWRSRISGSWTTPSTWEFSTNGGSTWIIATSTFPEVISSSTTIRNPNAVSINPSTPLAIDEFTIEGGASLSIGAGARLTINDGPGTDLWLSGTISGSGSIKTFGTPFFEIRNSGLFNAPLVLDSGDVSLVNQESPFIANLSGAVFISSGRSLNVNPGGYGVRMLNNLTNSGAITGNGSFFYMRGSSCINTGNISISNYNFDSTTLLDGGGIWNCSSISVNSTGNVTLSDTVEFGSTNAVNVIINSGGKISGAASYLLLNGSQNTVSMYVNSNGMVGTTSSTNLHTRGSVNIFSRNGALINATLNVKTGTTNCLNDGSPFIASFNGPIVVDNAAIINVNSGGYTILAKSNVTNNGTISGSASAFTMRGAVFTNNSTVSPSFFNFDSTTSLAGTGLWSGSTVNINSSGNVSLANNLSMGSSNVLALNILPGGILNPNTRILTLNGAANTVNLTLYGGGTTSNSGTIQTQGSVSINNRNGSNFNSPLKVNTGQTTGVNDNSPFICDFFGTITVDAAAILSVSPGGFTIRANNIVTNNGSINGAGSSFTMLGNVFTNSGNISPSTFNFDDTTSVSGAGVWGASTMNITGNGKVTLSGNISFGSPNQFNLNILSNGYLNPNGFTQTLDGSQNVVILNLSNAGSVLNSGILRTTGNVLLNLRGGSQLLSPVRINTGTTTFLNDVSPFEAIVYDTITIDTGAVLNIQAGGYTLSAYDNVLNNGTITSGGSLFKFYGSSFTNNGIVNPTTFNFETTLFSLTSFHTVSGTGSFQTSSCNVVQGANVTLGSNHKFNYLNINSGAIVDISNKTIKFTGAGAPVVNSGAFIINSGTVEYNGTQAQTLVLDNINYTNLSINDTSGVVVPSNFSISGLLSVISGDLNLNGKIITLLPSATLSETPGNTVTGSSGYLTTTRTLTAPSSLNVAGLGARITSAANLGLTEVRRGHSVQTLPGGNPSIKRYYAFNPANNSGLNATLVMSFDESELNGQTESQLSLFKSTNGGSNFFFETSTLNTVNNTFTKTGISSIARYTFGTGIGFLNLAVVPEGFYNTAIQKMNSRDTVRTYLRNVNSPYAIVDSAKGYLDSVSLSVSLAFSSAASGTYFIVVKHRNSIETWSKAGGESYTVGGTLNFNFTTGQTQAFGGNMTLKGTKWTIFSGDVNQDGSVDISDLSIIDNDAADFLSGYVPSDVNGDYTVDISDAAIADNNAGDFVSKITP